ncbi:MAG: thiol-disulfide isomerase/thioredoxin [Planctomycetota bacterium]
MPALLHSLPVGGAIGRAELADGKFTLSGEVDQVRPVYFYVLNSKTPEGHTMGAIKGQGFILEPGGLSLTMNGNHNHMVTGGYFNDGVYGAWLQSTAYQDLQAMIPLAFGGLPGETEAEKEASDRTGMAISQAIMAAETAGRREVALRHPDLLVRQLAIETAWLGGPWMLEGARGILALDPENEWAKGFAAREEARQGKAARHVQAAHVGGRYLPFTAASLAGEAISLSKTCEQNKYVLLEFWASWCGPCRSEIPHMKKAYERYHESGFEIFAYTLDDNQSAWEKASQEEELPWLNTGLGAKSDPVILYSVTGVPANYLIDASTGMVVARDLRGDKLEAKLEELLGHSSAQGK